MKNISTALLLGVFCLLFNNFASAQNCAPGSEVTAPAGGTVTTASTLTVYNSTETGPNSAANRTAVDAQDDAWRTGIQSSFPGSTFVTASDTVTAQGTASVPQTNIFSLGGINISYDYRDFQLDFRTTARPCIGIQIATIGERVVFRSKNNTMQEAEDAPRPASLYNTANQPLIYDEIQSSSQPNRITTANAILFSFASATRAFGLWLGDVETRTTGGGNPTIVRFLDASGNRIGSDVLIQPRTTTQASCGDSADGCGNHMTRWVGFRDTNSTARVRSMVIITGYQGGADSSWGDQRLSFIGPTIPIASTAAGVEVGGRVTTAHGMPIANVEVAIQSFDGDLSYTRTSTFGFYNFADVQAGRSYIVSINSKRFFFAPNSKLLNVLDTVNNLDFTAMDDGSPDGGWFKVR